MTQQNPFGMGLGVLRDLAASQAQIQNTALNRQQEQLRQAQEDRAAQLFTQQQDQAALAQQQEQSRQLYNLLGNLQSLPDAATRIQAVQMSPFGQMEGIDMLLNEQVMSDEGLASVLAANPFQQERVDDSLRFGTVNPRDYTPESLAKYQQSGSYADLERYYPLKQTEVGGVKYFADDQGNLFLPVTQTSQGQTEPATDAEVESGEAVPAPQPIDQLTPEQQMDLEAERAARIESAKAEVKTEAAAESPEALEQKRLKQVEVDKTKDLVNRLLASDDLGKISGAETGVPLVGYAQALFAQDALNDLRSLTNLLTMGNLGRMSGVLSESDIKLIANAASGIGMNEQGTPITEERLRQILTDIKGRLENPTGSMEDAQAPADFNQAQSLDELEQMLGM